MKFEEDKPADWPVFTFDLQGHGNKVYCGAFKERNIEKALTEARKCCKRFSQPGWELVCRETGDTFPAVCFINQDGEKVYQ